MNVVYRISSRCSLSAVVSAFYDSYLVPQLVRPEDCRQHDHNDDDDSSSNSRARIVLKYPQRSQKVGTIVRTTDAKPPSLCKHYTSFHTLNI